MTISSSAAFSRKAADVGLDPRSVLGIVFEGRPFATTHYVFGTYELSLGDQPDNSITLEEVAVDIGNSGAKTAVLHQWRHTLEFTQTPATYEETPTIIYGEHIETWQERYYADEERHLHETQGRAGQHEQVTPQFSEMFSIGEHANGRKSLPIGGTDLRLADPRYCRYVKACLVRGLIAAGYQPGHHYIGLAIGVRNEELNAKMGVDPAVQGAIDALKRPFTLIRNAKDVWRIEIRESVVLPQSFGTYYALDTGITGGTLHPIPHWTIMDLGYHDGHVLEINRSNGLQVTGQKVVTGVVDIARGLVQELRKPEHFPLVPSDLSDAEAIALLHSEELRIGGVPLQDEQEARRATAVIQAFKDREGGSLIGSMASRHTRLDSKFVYTGGGNTEFIPQIQRQMRVAKRPEHLYQVVPPEVARYANVAGVFWALNIRKRPLTVVAR